MRLPKCLGTPYHMPYYFLILLYHVPYYFLTNTILMTMYTRSPTKDTAKALQLNIFALLDVTIAVEPFPGYK